MASDQHQIICGLIIRMMKAQGYTQVCGFDGVIRDGYFSDCDAPPTIGRHRPDCIAYNPTTRKYAIGEAKTASDILSERTEEELIDFTNQCIGDERYDKVIFGFPSRSEPQVKKLMERLEQTNKKCIEFFKYPEELDDDI